MKYLQCLMLLFFAILGSAQDKTNSKTKNIVALKVGEKVPNIFLGKMLNHPTMKEAHLDDFKGRLLILDFWDTTCSVCINLFPKLPGLQNEFKKDLVLLPVGFDGRKPGNTERFLNRRKGTEFDLKIPSSIVDSNEVLGKYFPGQGFPRLIWIDPTGKLLGITHSNALSRENLKRVINGEKLELRRNLWAKNPIYATFDSLSFDRIPRQKPPFLDIGSRFTGFIDTAFSGLNLEVNRSSELVRITSINQCVYGLYIDAYSLFAEGKWLNTADRMKPKRFIIEGTTKPFYKHWPLGGDNFEERDFMENNLFCYDLLLPSSYTTEEAGKIVVQDLDRYLGIQSSLQMRKVKGLALVRTSKKDKFKTNSEYLLPEDKRTDPFNVMFRDQSFPAIVDLINWNIDQLVLDETNYSGKIDLDLRKDKKYTLQEYKTILKKYDLDLVEVERELPMLVLKDVRK